MKPLLSSLVALLIVAAFMFPHPALAARMAGVCDRAAARAADVSGVPTEILRAIARVEAGRRLKDGFGPWPWTVNQAGHGSFFDSKDLAIQHVQEAMARGESNIDIGCFQINLHWHASAFRSLPDMFDPDQNARYAAEFLSRLKQETGSWEAAVGAYHSRRSDAAEGYVAKVAEYLSNSATNPTSAPEGDAQPGVEAHRSNTYPLLQGSGGSLGSLVASDLHGGALPLFR